MHGIASDVYRYLYTFRNNSRILSVSSASNLELPPFEAAALDLDRITINNEDTSVLTCWGVAHTKHALPINKVRSQHTASRGR